MSPPSFMPNRSIGLKLIIVCALVLLMAIPAMFISYIAFERSDRADEVTREISQRYGGEQYISGPMVVVPYAKADVGGHLAETGFYTVFAETGEAVFENMSTDIRQRSLFKVPTYEGAGTLSSHFGAVKTLAEDSGLILKWEQAKLVVALSDVRGLNTDVTVKIDGGSARKFEPADINEYPDMSDNSLKTAVREIATSGPNRTVSHIPTPVTHNGWMRSHQNQSYLSVPVGDVLSKDVPFKAVVKLSVSGVSRFGISPFAQSTQVRLSSDWADPGFSGGFPPQDRDISAAGFNASWSVPYLRRGIRAHGKSHNLISLTSDSKLMTVQFVSTNNPYQTVNRALKYSVLFIGMVFLAYFLFEVIVGVRVHPAQYILIGLAQSIFYLLLLAFSERIGFTGAFVISSGATITATAGYAGAVFGGRAYIWRAGLVFSLVYGLLYSLMRMQDFALMIGALASFIAIAMTMYLTRGLDWYGLSQSKTSNQA